jgi:hypothetical protein
VRLYEGEREYKDFVAFMNNPMDENAFKHDPTESWKTVPGYEHVNLLDDSTFFEFIKTKPKVLVMFYAPWCGHWFVFFFIFCSWRIKIRIDLIVGFLTPVPT